jgi:hypothetical protein
MILNQEIVSKQVYINKRPACFKFMERDPDMEITTVQGLLLPLRADLAPSGI